MRTTRLSLTGVSIISLLMLALVAATPASAQEGADCVLKVRPGQGAPGSEFVFTGSGYQPDKLVLRREGGPTRTLELEPTEEDPFTIRILAGQGDSGVWKATAIETDVCKASVTFSVGLPPTATIGGPDEVDRSAALAAFAGLGVLFVLSSFIVLPRVTRSVRSR
jgi:hypothetical protein